MSFLNRDVQGAVDWFWRELDPLSYGFPRNLELALWAHQLLLVPVPDLNVEKVRQHLANENSVVPDSIRGQQRSIFGCLVAYAGAGYVFVDSSASQSEQRFTAAHEIGHFIWDYIFPRNRAISVFGEAVKDVLDGNRNPTEEERVHAILSNVNIRIYTDLLLRDEKNQIVNNHTNDSEITADAIALELLAPHQAVLEKSGLLKWIHTRQHIQTESYKTLVSYFGLPEKVAHIYSLQLGEYFRKRESVREWLKF